MPERFEDLLDAFEEDEAGEEELAREIREQLVEDLAGAKRLLEEGRPDQAQRSLDEALHAARAIVDEHLGPAAGGTGEGSPGAGSLPEGEEAYRVVIADENPTRRSLHRTLLEEAGPFEVVAEAEDDRRTVDAVRARAPDLVLLDVPTPEDEHLAALSELQRVAPQVALAVLPAFVDEGFASRARQAGVDLYLDEDLGGAELVDRLRELAAGGTHRDR